MDYNNSITHINLLQQLEEIIVIVIELMFTIFIGSFAFLKPGFFKEVVAELCMNYVDLPWEKNKMTPQMVSKFARLVETAALKGFRVNIQNSEINSASNVPGE